MGYSYVYIYHLKKETLYAWIKELCILVQKIAAWLNCLHFSVTPESIIIPIVSCILGFPLLALMVICCLRRRAKLARERARRRNCDLDHGALSLVRFSPVHRLGEFNQVKLGRMQNKYSYINRKQITRKTKCCWSIK